MKLKVLEGFYSKVLADLGVVDGGEGKLSYHTHPNVLNPVTVDGKRLCLPSRDNLKNLDLEHHVIFHPLAEQIVTGPSPILNALRKYIQLRLTTCATQLSSELMKLAADPKRQAKLPAKAKEILKALAEADPKAVTVLNRVLDAVDDTPETRMFNLYMRGRGTKEQRNGIRTTAVSYPILDDADTDEMETFNGIKMDRKTRDKPMVVAVLKYVLTGSVDSTEYIKEYTTSVNIAPYLNTLLTAFRDAATWQNEIISIFGKHIPEIREIGYNLDWLEEMDDFEDFAKKIGSAAPSLPGNSGKVLEDAEDEIAENEERIKETLNWRDVKDDIPEEPVRRRERDEEDYDDRRRRHSRDEDDVPNWKRAPERSALRFGERSRRDRGFDLGRDDRGRGRDRDRSGRRDRDDRSRRGRNW